MFKGVVTDVFFDLDHTLWDFEKNSELTFQSIFEKHDLQVDLENFLKVYTPINFKFWKLYREEKVTKENLRYERLKQSFDAIGKKVDDDTIHGLSEDYIKNLSSFGHLISGTFEILEYLKGSYRLHIITNGFAETQRKKMINSKISGYFEIVVNSEMAGVKKPNPKIFQMALEKANTLPDTSLMIGDNLEADILGAKAVGFHTLHFNSNGENFHEFSKIIHHLHEIKHFL